MRQSWRVPVWCAMLTKRMLKKLTYLLILLLIPCLVLGYWHFAGEQSGVVTIALASEDAQDAFAQAVFSQLDADSNLIRFAVCASPDDAVEQVRGGKADAAWIFDENLSDAVASFATSGKYGPFVRVVEREQTTQLLLARERLSATLFENCSRTFYLSYLRKNAQELDMLSDEELLSYYEAVMLEGKLFDFSLMPNSKTDSKNAYLKGPVRGFCAVMIVLCAMAASIYYRKDEDSGIFCWIANKHRAVVQLVYHVVCIGPVMTVSVLCLALVGQTGALWTELVMALVYGICCTLFAMVLGTLIRKASHMAVAIPVACITMTAICPVLYDLDSLLPYQKLFLPTYYINGPYSNDFLVGMLLYGAVLSILFAVFQRISVKEKSE